MVVGFSATLLRPNTPCSTRSFTNTVVNNSTALQVDLGCLRDIVLSYFQFGHTSRLTSMMARIRTGYADKLDVYLGKGFFNPRIIDTEHPAGDMSISIGCVICHFMQEKCAQLKHWA